MMERNRMLILLSIFTFTGLYKNGTERHPYIDLYYEQKMMEAEKTIPIKELA